MLRAASMVHRDLGDVDQAFTWLGDSLIAHVDSATLDALEELALQIGDPPRAEATLSRALGEVFDGPLVRQLLARRAKLRRERLNDRTGAALDLKKLHELSPSDQAVTDELSALLTELGDYRAMVLLYEDLILRGKDLGSRAELARKVALMWEEQLADPREAADAWRRVLRMKPGDAEGTAGLERAKVNMLRRPEPSGELEAPIPPPPADGPAEGTEETLAQPPSEAPGVGDARPTPVPAGDEPRSVEERETTPADTKPKKRKSKRRATDERDASAGGQASPEAHSEERTGASEPPPLEIGASAETAADIEVVIADELAEMIEAEDAGGDPEDSPKTKPGNGKRSVPPPLPRG
jgi:tetratricopeptide (TPR) repeat protein